MWEIYDDLIAAVPPHLRVSDCCVGLNWILVKSETTGIAMTPKEGFGWISFAGQIVGMKVREVAGYLKSWNNFEAAIALAAVNSALNTEGQVLKLSGRPVHSHEQANAFIYHYEQLAGKKVAVIGRFPDLEFLKNICRLSVLERRPGSEDFPDPACEYILPEQDFIFITATTLINKTLPRLLELAKNSKVVLVGPSTPFTPRLFAYGITTLAGSVVDGAKAWSFVQQGGGGMDIFEHGCHMVKIDALESEAKDVRRHVG